MLPLLKTLHKLLHDNNYIQTTMLLVIAGSVSSLFNTADTGTLDKNDLDLRINYVCLQRQSVKIFLKIMEPCIIIHGGCRPIPEDFKEPYKQGVQLAARKGYAVLLEVNLWKIT